MPPASRRISQPPSAALRDLSLDGHGPLQGQIYRAIRTAILAGRAGAGTRLPASRVLAREFGVSRNTVVAALGPLRSEGYLESRVGAGTFVARQLDVEPSERARAGGTSGATEVDPGSVRLTRYGLALHRSISGWRREYDRLLDDSALTSDFRPCVPDLERLSDEAWRRSLIRTAQHMPSSSLDYADPAGSLDLRAELSRYLARARGVLCEVEDIVIVGGVSQALDLAARLFVEEGEGVLVEDPHYLGVRRTLAAAGATLVSAPVDAHGLELSNVPREELDRCRLAYVTPSHQFPTGAVMSLSRRLALLRWAERSDAFVIEDDYDSEFRYAGRAIEALKSLDEKGRVIYVGTFSKTLFPGLRLAYLVLPRGLVELFRSAKWLTDWASPAFEQAALARFMREGDFERHLRRARTLYAESRELLVGAIQRELSEFGVEWSDSQAGLHLLLRFPSIAAGRTRAIVHSARECGVGLYPAAPCYVSPPDHLELILGFSRLDGAGIDRGIEALRDLLRADSRASSA